MNYNQSTVQLAIKLHGTQKSHGSYSHYSRVEPNGHQTNGVRFEKVPTFCKAYKTVHLGNEFVNGALNDAPEHMNMRPQVWRRLPEKKRIAIHVGLYVMAMHPEHRGYEMMIS